MIISIYQLIDKNINWFKFSLGTIFNDMCSWPQKLGLKMHCQTFFWSAQRRSMVILFLFGYTCKNKIYLFKQFFLQTYVDVTLATELHGQLRYGKVHLFFHLRTVSHNVHDVTKIFHRLILHMQREPEFS